MLENVDKNTVATLTDLFSSILFLCLKPPFPFPPRGKSLGQNLLPLWEGVRNSIGQSIYLIPYTHFN
jgi:hypothetical protein